MPRQGPFGKMLLAALPNLETPAPRPTIGKTETGGAMADLFAPWGFWSGLPCAIETAPPPFATLDRVLLELPTLELRGRAAEQAHGSALAHHVHRPT